ncbi:MAG: hypothetical protein GQ560_03385 [Dehalococcoidia bacterium]|nr:hypothetical protein [Dehalococcoidia bacterium]
MGRNKCDGGSQFLDSGDKVIECAISQPNPIIGLGCLGLVGCVDIKLAGSLSYFQT